MKRPPLIIAALAVASVIACNGLLGIEEITIVPSLDAIDGGVKEGGTNDAVNGADQAVPPTDDAGADAYPDPGFPCGANPACDPSKQEVCCAEGNLTTFDALYGPTSTCTTTCAKVAVECNSTRDCVARGERGQICCAELTGADGNGVRKINRVRCTSIDACAAIAVAAGDQNRVVALCDPNDPELACRPTALGPTTCCTYPRETSYSWCQPGTGC